MGRHCHRWKRTAALGRFETLPAAHWRRRIEANRGDPGYKLTISAPTIADAREWRRRCRLLSSYFSNRPAAAPAEPCSGLVLKATSWAGNRQSRAALTQKRLVAAFSAVQLGQRI